MKEVADFLRPYKKLDGVGNDMNYLEQDGVVYGWSESNFRFEFAWFLYIDMSAVTPNVRNHIENILKDRPFPGTLPLRMPVAKPSDPYTLDSI